MRNYEERISMKMGLVLQLVFAILKYVLNVVVTIRSRVLERFPGDEAGPDSKINR